MPGSIKQRFISGGVKRDSRVATERSEVGVYADVGLVGVADIGGTALRLCAPLDPV